LRGRLNISRKKASSFYLERNKPQNKKRKREQLDPDHGLAKFELCCSTDESGNDNNLVRIYGYSAIRNILSTPLQKRRLQGRSYRRTDTRIHQQQLKHSIARVNICATICDESRKPVVKLEILEKS
jgi:hypothetical protein